MFADIQRDVHKSPYNVTPWLTDIIFAIINNAEILIGLQIITEKAII